ncbi:N-6 DNA methylase [Asticcacaulis sp. BYS171W]|uniref:site-specific DNA-methyltransferase (adenine-specific) n=1 Tax=Asticcacaulis aquaticus TaxID=2984212 RepID=A0ABT5HWR4_9CAUL|nr:N-6 DNA methylase [Asticcacaulis aquaticus]MDC7684520.1 N-6 DNA methylase [Asticcacaulis aquaticus]
MKSELVHEIQRFRNDVSRANNESAKISLLTSLLTRLFDGDDAGEIIRQFSLGTEKAILNVHRAGKLSQRGRADTQYQRIIIEFEKDLKLTERHAKDQLADYLSGIWNSGEVYNYTLISSDCSTWIVYSPDLSTAEKLKSEGVIFASDIILEEKERFELNVSNSEEFYYFLDAYLFKSEKQKASLENIRRDFGQTSDTFIEAYGAMYAYFQTVKDTGEVQVAFEQWQRFLSIAYGSFDASEQIFIIHSYLSIFAKILAYEIITQDDHIDDAELKGIIRGSIFTTKNVVNFTDNDFFHWIGSDAAFVPLKRAYRALVAKIDGYDFKDVDEDILKGVYQELIDRDTRHHLGEYYTPDWLCERVVENLDLKKSSKIMDPSCGSGSFLRATIGRLKREYPDISADQLADQVCGIDIHPLSVLVAKTTVLLALGDKIQAATRPIVLNVFLADTLLTPTGSVNLDLFGDEFKLWIDRSQYSINTSVFNNPGAFDAAVNIAEGLADFTKNSPSLDQKAFASALGKKVPNIPSHLINSFYNIYIGLKTAKEENRDSIWKFIIQNLYKPCFYYRQFDFIVGNPPWFTYSSIGNSQYQNRLRELAADHNLTSKVANLPHLEIAAIFLAHCTNYFLLDGGKLAFVLPRSFFSADHHDNIRSGKALNMKIIDLWDLDGVSPLFNVPSCVLFTERPRPNSDRNLPKSGRKGKEFKGRLKAHNLNWEQTKDKISFTPRTYHYSKLGQVSAFTEFKLKPDAKQNHYKKQFKQGATVVPRNFYFVDVTQDFSGPIGNRILTVKSSKSMEKDAKAPWKNLPPFEGRIDTNFLFRTAISRNVLPYYLHNPELVLLPARIGEGRKLEMLSSDDIFSSGEIDTAKWFRSTEDAWNKLKTEKNKSITASEWVDYHGKLTQQDMSCKYVVLYTSSAKDANACVVSRDDFDLEFIVEHKTYGYGTNDEDEANYICSFLNATEPNRLIKAFQTRGLFGARDVHKKILEVPFPAFKRSDPDHMSLALQGKAVAKKASLFFTENQLPTHLGTRDLGQARVKVRKFLKSELETIDKLIKRIVED